MKRDTDLIRTMLFEFEESSDYLIMDKLRLGMSPEEQEWQHHLELLSDQGFVTPVGKGTFRLTASGHDFIDAIRDEGIWRQTKEAVVATGGSVTLEIMKVLAVGLLKKKISEHTGVEL